MLVLDSQQDSKIAESTESSHIYPTTSTPSHKTQLPLPGHPAPQWHIRDTP